MQKLLLNLENKSLFKLFQPIKEKVLFGKQIAMEKLLKFTWQIVWREARVVSQNLFLTFLHSF